MLNPFRSFWMGGFECADHTNLLGDRVDLLNATGHLERAEADYAGLAEFQIRTVREGIRWSQVETSPYHYDWTAVGALMKAGRAARIQQVWDLCHFGFPSDLTPLHPHFAPRFASLCRAFVTFFRSQDRESILIITPMNEVSFLAWLGGDVAGTSPYAVDQGWPVKYALLRACLAGIIALRETDPTIRLLTTEPLVNIVPAFDAGARARRQARAAHQAQFQVTDAIAGRICPELGGRPEFLDIVGWNYYFNNQWVHHPHQTLGWRDTHMDDRWVPLHRLLRSAYLRYRRPVILSETSHPGEDRPLWMRQIADECALAIQHRVPLWGVCWYPLVDRPDWNHLQDWHHSGLWDRSDTSGDGHTRELHEPLARIWHEATLVLAESGPERKPRTAARQLLPA